MSSREQVLDVLRKSLERGETVEVDGLGTFRPARKGGYEFLAQTLPRVFIAYVEEDLELARRLYAGLLAADCAPWLDKEKLLPGQNWPRALERAIGNSDAVLACFSPRSIAKRGQFQAELHYALDCARRRPLDSVYLIPVRFAPCTLPRRITEHVQYVDLFPDWQAGFGRVVQAIRQAGCPQAPVLAT